jgi:BON domain
MSLHRAVALVMLSVVLAGCSLAGRTFGTYVDDKVITGSVRRGMASQHWRLFRGVTVDTYEGTVYLSGDVDTAEQKTTAEDAAWRVTGVQQVVNDVRVRLVPQVSASPRMTEPSALRKRLPGLRRIDPAAPGAGALAYDAAGDIVATVFVRPLKDLGVNGFDALGPTVRPITYVSLYPVPAAADQPESLVTIVLWHISPAAAAALKPASTVQ